MNKLVGATFIAIFLLLGWLTHYGIFTKQFTPDSWALFELSKTVFTDFFHANTYRQFIIETPYSRAFPPLFPVLMAILNRIFDVGIFSGICLNICAVVVLLCLLLFLSRRVTGELFVGIVTFFTLISSAAFVEEFQAGRTITTTLALFFGIVAVVISKSPWTVGRSVGLGILAGMAALNRFDFLAVSIGLGIFVACLRRSWWNVGTYYGALILTLSPWIYYSFSQFATPWATDSGYFLRFAFEGYPQDYYPKDWILATLWTHPLDWLTMTMRHIIQAGKSVVIMRFLFVPVLFCAGILWLLRGRPVSLVPGPYTRRLLLLSAVSLFHVVPVLLAATYQPRYFLLELGLGALLLLTWTHEVLSRMSLVGRTDSRRVRLQEATLIITMLVCVSSYAHRFLLSSYAYNRSMLIRGAELPTEEAELEQFIRTLPASRQRVLMIAGGIYPARFGALTGIPTYLSPSNLNDEVLAALVSDRGVPLIYSDDELERGRVHRIFEVDELLPNLFAIVKIKDEGRL